MAKILSVSIPYSSQITKNLEYLIFLYFIFYTFREKDWNKKIE